MPREPALPDLPPPTLVADQDGFEGLLEDLAGQKEIAFDTEADSFFNYREKVCLIQVTVEDRDYLIDPLSDIDVSGLGKVFADPKRTKVFHDGEYDVLILKRDFGFEFAGLFDTRIAAAALGQASPGLASVLSNRFGVELDKSMQRSNWSRRPLSPQQISYARLDTRYLLPLMHEQRKELASAERDMIVEGECRRLEALKPSDRTFQPDDFIRIKGARLLTPTQMQRLRELFIYRDKQAESRDLPPFKILSNKALLSLAANGARTEKALAEVDGISPKQAKRLGSGILKALKRAADKGPLPKIPRPPAKDGTNHLGDEGIELHERLKNWRKRRAEKEGLDSSLVLNRHVLLRLAEKRPREGKKLESIDGLLSWQVDLFGDEILRVVTDFESDLKSGQLKLNHRRRRK